MKIDTCHLGFLGFGHMAKIIYRSLERSRLIPRSQILFSRRNPRKIHDDEKEFGITATSLETLVAKSDLILLCVRPNQAEEVLNLLAAMPLEGKRLVSILAGTPISHFEKFLGSIPLIRAMPNVASAVGEGMTTLTAGRHANSDFKSLAHLLFSSMGQTVELPESCMDMATAIAGSGPAYAFSFIEAAARQGERQGIAYETALKMAAQTFLGAAKMLLQAGVSVQEQINQIAVPNGTTEAGLKVLKDLEIEKKFQDVLSAAAARSQAISQHRFS